MPRFLACALAALGIVWAGSLPVGAQATGKTRVMVRVVSRDAKVVGSSIGGAQITIRDAQTGRVLAEGKQLGGTGSTDRIMRQPRLRDAVVYGTEDAASFTAELELSRPTEVEIEARGPLAIPHAIQTASKRLLLVPGRDISGEGILLELHGLIVEILNREEVERLRPGESADLRARVRLM